MVKWSSRGSATYKEQRERERETDRESSRLTEVKVVHAVSEQNVIEDCDVGITVSVEKCVCPIGPRYILLYHTQCTDCTLSAADTYVQSTSIN